MKITCDSCGSKYTIADAKVAGKKVKVRCKGCGESILVDGTKVGEGGSDDAADDGADEAAAPADAAPADEPKKDKDLWSVNLTDDDSRDMTLDELVAGWKDGTVTSDAYVWKDGMGDWKPILEVGELKLKLGSAPKKGGGVVSSASATAGAAGAAAASDDKMDDLFGGTDDAVNAPSEVELPAGGGDEKPTGARNDSSVLFSLDSLNTGGDAPEEKKASGDDLFAGLGTSGPGLTGNADLLTAPAKDPPPAPAGNRAAAPPVEQKSGKGGLIAAILGAAVIIAGGLAFAMGGGDDEAKKEVSAADAEADAKAKAEAEAKQKALDEKMAKLEKMEAELKKAKEEALKKGEDPEEAAKKKKEELEKEKAEAEKKEAEAKSSGSGSSKPSGSSSSGPKPAAKPAPKADAGGAKFDVGAAKAALSAAAANAAACKKPGGPTGSGKVQVTFSTSGRVTSSTVISGPFGGTAVGGCVASTFRRARVPKFSGSPKTVAKSFRIN